MKTTISLFIMFFLCTSSLFAQQNNDYLLLVGDEEAQKYVDKDGKTVIPEGKYMCFTDTFRTKALVLHQEEGFVAIDRNENIAYKVFTYDNYPDEASEGLFRIVQDGKIGYADISTLEIVIKPQFEAAYPFSDNGTAEVTFKVKKSKDGEYTRWESDSWFFIDKAGKKVK